MLSINKKILAILMSAAGLGGCGGSTSSNVALAGGTTTSTTVGTISTGCTDKVAAFFNSTKGSYSTAASTYGPNPAAPATVAGFSNGTVYTVTVKSDCTIAVGAVNLTYKDGSYAESPGTGASLGKTQIDVDMVGAGVALPHYEVFTTGKRALGFVDPADNRNGLRLDE
jgi:hypothetical protein